MSNPIPKNGKKAKEITVNDIHLAVTVPTIRVDMTFGGSQGINLTDEYADDVKRQYTIIADLAKAKATLTVGHKVISAGKTEPTVEKVVNVFPLLAILRTYGPDVNLSGNMFPGEAEVTISDVTNIPKYLADAVNDYIEYINRRPFPGGPCTHNGYPGMMGMPPYGGMDWGQGMPPYGGMGMPDFMRSGK
jgi:hypothetical protein